MASPIEQWVEESARLTTPKKIVWCDGSEAQRRQFIEQMLADGTLISLNPKTYPNCYLHRSDPSDVARTEQITFICSRLQSDAGPTNNWMSPADAKEKVSGLFRWAMKDRTMYVVPYLMGPAGSPYSKVGVEITDSLYVVASMYIMARIGQAALDRLGNSNEFVPGLHSLGDLSPDRRYVLHFPEDKLIWSIGSGYGGNALLGKKCFALRIASWMAREQSWMAEHMLIVGLTGPSGRTHYIAAAFPSACGKTNLAMMVSALEKEGYRVWTVGDDIAWMHVAADGTLRAINPEAGFFGVAPGTNSLTNPNVMAAIRSNTIFTNVALTSAREPWWEGMETSAPDGLISWQGQPWKLGMGSAAHPNSRYTVSAAQSSSISSHWEDPAGVPISALIFGGRRARLAPLVYESFSWQHGVFVGATMASETTAAATGAVGVTRRDPMAMLPFCGYNMADYWAHWLSIGPRLKHPPKIFHVNWFRRGADGKFLWPGYGQNIRALKWMLKRIEGRAGATETPIGCVPTSESLNLDGLSISSTTLQELLRVNPDNWSEEERGVAEFFQQFGQRLPAPIRDEQKALTARLSTSTVPAR